MRQRQAIDLKRKGDQVAGMSDRQITDLRADIKVKPSFKIWIQKSDLWASDQRESIAENANLSDSHRRIRCQFATIGGPQYT